jgi:hypothetical protein
MTGGCSTRSRATLFENLALNHGRKKSAYPQAREQTRRQDKNQQKTSQKNAASRRKRRLIDRDM